MVQQNQINSVIVKINMDATGHEPRFAVEEVIAQPGSFKEAENFIRARFECLCCKTGYVVLPLIMQKVITWTEMKVSIDPNLIQKHEKHFSENGTGKTLNEAVDSAVEQKQDVEIDDFKIEAELFLLEDSFETAPLDNQFRVGQTTDLEEGDFGWTPSELSLNEVLNSDEGDGHAYLKMEDAMAFPMGFDADSVGTPPVKQQFRVGQTSEVKESDVLTPSEERSLKMQCLRSKSVIRLVRVDEEHRKKNASVAPMGPQERNVKGGINQCNICKAVIKYRHHLSRHMNIHLGIRFSCSECQESFSDKSSLNKHLRRRHPGSHIKGRQPNVQNFNGSDFPCVYCEPKSVLNDFEELEDHLSLVHDRNFACRRCPKAFKNNINLKDHIAATHEKKKFKCPKCGKVFAWNVTLKSHLRSHK